MKSIPFNNTASNRVLLATFDSNWKRSLQDSHVIYTATSNNAKVVLLIERAPSQTLVFNKGKRIFVVGGTFHFPSHIQVIKSSSR